MDTTSQSLPWTATVGEPVTMVTLSHANDHHPGTGDSGKGVYSEAPEGCLTVEQGDFVPWDNPDNILSRKTDLWVSTVFIGTIVLPVLFAVGVPGNILSAVVFKTQGLKDRINLCLFSLALADLLVLVSNFCLTEEKVYRDLVGFSAFFITYFPGITGVTWVSQFLSAVIASERCFCVVSPLQAQRRLKTSSMAGVIVLCSALLLGGMLGIAGPKHTAVCMFDPLTNRTKDIVYVTRYYLDNKELLDIFDVFFYATAFPAIFLLVVIVTTVVTAVKLRHVLAWRQSNAKSGAPVDNKTKILAKEAALTKMLIVTSILFIVCLVPILLVQVATFLVKDLNYDGRYHNLTSVLWQCINAFRCLNSSLNFVVYFRMGSKFRETLRGLFSSVRCCGKWKE